LTYFDVVRALHEALAISGPLLAYDPHELDVAIRALHEWGQRRALRRAGASRWRWPKLVATHPQQWQAGVDGRRGTSQGQAGDDGNGVRENEEGEGRRMDANCSALSN